FTVNNADLQFLAQGQSVVQTYTVEVDDNHGGSATQTVSITINGSEDAPSITAAVASGSVTEDAHVAATESASGTIDFADVDLIDTHTVSATPAAGGYLGTFTPTITNVSTGDGAGQVTWNFTVNNADLQFLAQGQSVVQTYTADPAQNPSDPATQTVSITIN